MHSAIVEQEFSSSTIGTLHFIGITLSSLIIVTVSIMIMIMVMVMVVMRVIMLMSIVKCLFLSFDIKL